LSVCRLRRVVFDTVELDRDPWPKPPSAGKRVAVIGSGPAGLAAAHFLQRMGREVTVFEAAPQAGGMLRHGIPAYRLPRQALEKDLEWLIGQGIEIRTKMALGRELSLEGLREEGFHAVLIAAGAGAAKQLAVEGTELEGVLAGVRFLRDVAVGSFPPAELEGRRVVVIGGGDVALDAARTALRLGASPVTLVCLEAAEAMPAHRAEIDEAREEGVEILHSWGPDRILGTNGNVRGVRLVRCVAVFDESGRFAPRFDGDTRHEVRADAVIAAIGQEVERGLREHPDLEFGRNGFLSVTSEDQSMGTDGVFAAGDLALGPSSVVRSVASGRRAAESIDRFLGGSGEVPSILDPETPDQWIGREEGFGARPRVRPVEIDPTERVRDFSEVESVLAGPDAREEAARCLQCDLRLSISAPVFPPQPWIAFTADAVDGVPDTAGVFWLLGEDRVATKIQGTPNLRQALVEELAGGGSAPYFMFEEDAMYTKRESELIQQFLARHGHMPEGDGDLDDLF
jgi:NADPH-dependent glutamate synthase beta subunit-like oxidoreductase